MNKRIVCVLLTLIMLVGMLPMAASATGKSVSERAITVLKQMQNYSKSCSKEGEYGTEYRNGYGTICTEKGDDHTQHSISESTADKALRAKLKELDAAVNAAGLNLNQNQHDALVVLSYDIGTSWLNGTGVLKSAVTQGLTGNAFINAIGHTSGTGSNANWKVGEVDRRMIEANMYLNGAYSNVAPSNYTYVNYDANGGTMAEGTNGKYTQYFDKSLNATPAPVPTKAGYIFLGWYQDNGNTWVSKLSTFQGGTNAELTAQWQAKGATYKDAKSVYNWLSLDMLANKYIYDNPADCNITGTQTNKNVIIDRDFIDANGARWGRLQGDKGWVLVSGTANGKSMFDIDVTVTVTNSYVRSRVNASVTSKQNGTYKQGDQLRIVDTANGSGFLWGQVANEYNETIGWVALMYTNWNAVKDNANSSNGSSSSDSESKLVATAVVNCQGYLNVRSGAGTDNAIVGALADGDHVDIYEIKFVNGHQWGRTSEGWILLTYAKVTMQNSKLDYSNSADVLAYTFTGTLKTAVTAHTEASHSSETVGKKIAAGTLVAMSMVKNDTEGNIWGFNGTGWIALDNVFMDVAKYVVVSDSVSVRKEANSSATTVEKIVKGVELDISEIAVVDATIWGKTEKYGGWVNLASKYVQRSNAPVIDNVDSKNYNTGLVATVINTGSVKVRSTGATYGSVLGSLSNGTTVAVWEANSNSSWYKVDSNQNGEYDYEADGWVSAQYLNVHEGTVGGDQEDSSNGTTGSNGSTAVETGLGIVANTYTGVRVRAGAGTGYAVKGQLLTGTTVEILEVTTTATSKWGRTEQGWVCMDYITMISKYPMSGTTTGATDSNAGQNVGGYTSETTDNTTIDSTPAVYTGTIKSTEAVKVLKTADEDAIVVTTLSNGENITVQELRKITNTVVTGEVVDGNATTTTSVKETTYWARVNGGWIQNPQDTIALNALDERIYTVKDYAEVNVRAAADGEAAIVTSIEKGTQVAITKLEIVGDKVWGYTDDLGEKSGWIRLDNMAEGAITVNNSSSNNNSSNTTGTTGPVLGNGSNSGGYVTNTSGYRYTGKVINTDSLNVRAIASTGAAKTTSLKYGDSLVIYETTISENMAWGRCDAGWVYLYYVDLTPVVDGAVDARVVYNENSIIYTDANCSAVAGTYARMSVIDIYEIVGTMARTDKGWVKTTDLL